MPKLPSAKPRLIIKALQKAGFKIHHIKGSHYTLKHPTTKKRVVISYKNKEMKPGTLGKVIERSGLSEDEFLSLL